MFRLFLLCSYYLLINSFSFLFSFENAVRMYVFRCYFSMVYSYVWNCISLTVYYSEMKIWRHKGSFLIIFKFIAFEHMNVLFMKLILDKICEIDYSEMRFSKYLAAYFHSYIRTILSAWSSVGRSASKC